MSAGLTQRSNSANNRAKPLQLSTNIIHTKIPKRIDNVIHHEKARQAGKQILNDPLKKEAVSSTHKISKKVDNKSSQTPKDENDVAQFAINKGSNKPSTGETPIKKVDENDVSEYVKNAYDPLVDIHPFDEELYKKVMKLELADDGLPTFESDEAFDF